MPFIDLFITITFRMPMGTAPGIKSPASTTPAASSVTSPARPVAASPAVAAAPQSVPQAGPGGDTGEKRERLSKCEYMLANMHLGDAVVKMGTEGQK